MTSSPAVVASELDPNSFEEPALEILAVLFNQKLRKRDAWLTASSISTILRDQYGSGLHWRKIYNALFEMGSAVVRRKKSRQWEFAILRQGEERLGAAQASILFIDPTQAFKATPSLHEFFSKLKGTIRVCDAYLDNVTLEHLHAVDKSAIVRVLTKNVKDSGQLRRLIAAWKTRGGRWRFGSLPAHRFMIDTSSTTQSW